MAKKENNRRNYSARERWLREKKVGRRKQIWLPKDATYEEGGRWYGEGVVNLLDSAWSTKKGWRA